MGLGLTRYLSERKRLTQANASRIDSVSPHWPAKSATDFQTEEKFVLSGFLNLEHVALTD